MNFNELKEMARRLGGVLVMDGNEPGFVILSYDKFRKLEAFSQSYNGIAEEVSFNNYHQAPDYSVEEGHMIDKLNQEISALKEEIRQKESAEVTDDISDTIDSL